MSWRTAVALLSIGLGVDTPRLAAQAVQDSVGASAVTHPSAASGRLGDAMPRSYSGSSCLSGLSQTKVKRAIASLKDALESQTSDARNRALQEGEQALAEAIAKDKQDKNAGAWYSLGQIYLYQDNVPGADSALRRAAALAPGCRSDIDDLRYIAWAPLMNGGIELSKAKSNDSALVLFRKAVMIYPDRPHAALNAGILFANSEQLDSAIVYFGQAAEVAERVKLTDERNRATFNLAAVLQQLSRHAEAVQALEKYLGWVPDDQDAKDALATSYRGAGQIEKAQELEKVLLVTAAAAPADSSAAGKDAGRRSTANVLRIGVNFYNDQKYADAAAAFEKVVETEANNRDAIYNLANTYFAMKENAKLVEIGVRLLQIEPMSENALQLLGNGYKNTNDIDRAIKIAEQLLAMPADITVKEFVTRAGEAKLTMTATGRAAQTPAGKSIPPQAVPLTFEFLDASGTVVTTQDAECPELKPDQVHEFVLDVKGQGIVAWRYRRKP